MLGESAPWLPENRGKTLAFQMKCLDCRRSVRAAMDVLRPGEGNSGWAVTEVVERGGVGQGEYVAVWGEKGALGIAEVG